MVTIVLEVDSDDADVPRLILQAVREALGEQTRIHIVDVIGGY